MDILQKKGTQRYMARPFTSGEREEYGIEAYEKSVRGYSQRRIAKELGIARATVASLLEEQRKHHRRERGETVERVLDGLDAAIAESWSRLGALPPDSTSYAAPNLLSGINALTRTKIDVLGFKAPTKSEQKLKHSYENSDWSALTDEELDQMERLVDKAMGG
jgi:transcriptional regulator with XRE-family HTH domain